MLHIAKIASLFSILSEAKYSTTKQITSCDQVQRCSRKLAQVLAAKNSLQFRTHTKRRTAGRIVVLAEKKASQVEGAAQNIHLVDLQAKRAVYAGSEKSSFFALCQLAPFSACASEYIFCHG